MGVSAAHRPHLVQHDRDAGSRDLPSGFAASKTAADNVDSGDVAQCAHPANLGAANRYRQPGVAPVDRFCQDTDRQVELPGDREDAMVSSNVRHGAAATTRSDLEALTALNRDYINSVQHGDVRRFDEILAEDFLCSNPDGSLVDRKGFLAQTARPVTITGLAIDDVKVRILGDVAIIHARTTYKTADGERRNGRYTDVWARRDGKWLAVSAHVTR
jgi:ketosteroid isomerase-like protein